MFKFAQFCLHPCRIDQHPPPPWRKLATQGEGVSLLLRIIKCAKIPGGVREFHFPFVKWGGVDVSGVSPCINMGDMKSTYLHRVPYFCAHWLGKQKPIDLVQPVIGGYIPCTRVLAGSVCRWDTRIQCSSISSEKPVSQFWILVINLVHTSNFVGDFSPGKCD